MRHLKRTAKLGRTSEHRNAMLANLVCSLIEHKRVTTTLAKAKAARSVAEKMVTLGKKGTIHHRRLAVARLHQEAAAQNPVQGDRARFQGPPQRLHPHHQARTAPGRCRPARDLGMGGHHRHRPGARAGGNALARRGQAGGEEVSFFGPAKPALSSGLFYWGRGFKPEEHNKPMSSSAVTHQIHWMPRGLRGPGQTPPPRISGSRSARRECPDRAARAESDQPVFSSAPHSGQALLCGKRPHRSWGTYRENSLEFGLTFCLRVSG